MTIEKLKSPNSNKYEYELITLVNYRYLNFLIFGPFTVIGHNKIRFLPS